MGSNLPKKTPQFRFALFVASVKDGNSDGKRNMPMQLQKNETIMWIMIRGNAKGKRPLLIKCLLKLMRAAEHTMQSAPKRIVVRICLTREVSSRGLLEVDSGGASVMDEPP
mmetsp:Transcript_26365/g.59536  ORF Transcript_26365/g.59536 Transcript_26365/m.59536 type:complete len:111 (-) Transcript_26365:53-385(-)